jgi:hypothetical protein
MTDTEKMRADCERLDAEGKHRRAAQQWLELSDRLALEEKWDEAVKAAEAAAESAHRVGLRLFLHRGAA